MDKNDLKHQYHSVKLKPFMSCKFKYMRTVLDFPPCPSFLGIRKQKPKNIYDQDADNLHGKEKKG